MFSQHVGIRRYSQFLNQVYELLDDNGVFVMQVAGIRTCWQYEDLNWGLLWVEQLRIMGYLNMHKLMELSSFKSVWTNTFSLELMLPVLWTGLLLKSVSDLHHEVILVLANSKTNFVFPFSLKAPTLRSSLSTSLVCTTLPLYTDGTRIGFQTRKKSLQSTEKDGTESGSTFWLIRLCE